MPPATHNDAILDAARDSVMAVGVARTTLSDVARRAGMSRPTVYRRHPDIASVLGALMAREFGALLEAARAEAAGAATVRAQIVGALTRGARALVEHPLWQRLLDVDPELLLPYVTLRTGAFQDAVRATVAELIAAGIAEGSVRRAEPQQMAAALEAALRGFVLSPATAPLDELEPLIDAYLTPTEETA